MLTSIPPVDRMMPELQRLASGCMHPCDIVIAAMLSNQIARVTCCAMPSRSRSHSAVCVLASTFMLATCLLVHAAGPDRNHEAELGSSPAAKCARYSQVWTEATGKRGLKGVGETFRARHDAFLASGCQSTPDVCPRSKEELDLANVLVLRGMSAKLASTFFPFRCGG